MVDGMVSQESVPDRPGEPSFPQALIPKRASSLDRPRPRHGGVIRWSLEIGHGRVFGNVRVNPVSQGIMLSI